MVDFFLMGPNVYLRYKQSLSIGVEILQTFIISSQVLLKLKYLWCSATNYNNMCIAAKDLK